MKKSTLGLIICGVAMVLLIALCVLFGRDVLYKLSVSTANLPDEEKTAISACISHNEVYHAKGEDGSGARLVLPDGSCVFAVRDYPAKTGVHQYIATKYNFDAFYEGLPDLEGYQVSDYDLKSYEAGEQPQSGHVTVTTAGGDAFTVRYQWFKLRFFIVKSWFCVFTVEG